MTVVRKTIIKAKAEGNDYILSDASIDRYGDSILSSGWVLDNFRKNPVALFAHNASFVIGKWKNVRVSNNALLGSLDLAPAGTSDRIDEIRKLVDADILKSVSVGFTPLTYKERDDGEVGFIYEQQELIECS